MNKPSIPNEIAALGKHWTEAFLLLADGGTKKEASVLAKVSDKHFLKKIKEFDFDNQIKLFNTAQAKNAEEKYQEDAQRARERSISRGKDLEDALAIKINEAVERDSQGNVIGVSDDINIRDLETAVKAHNTLTNSQFKATGQDVTDKVTIATAGKSETNVVIPSFPTSPAPNPQEFMRRLAKRQGKLIENEQDVQAIDNKVHLDSPNEEEKGE